MRRRDLLASLPAGVCMLHSATQDQHTSDPHAAGTRLIIGTSGRGSEGIYVSALKDGKLSEPVLAERYSNPSFLALPYLDSPFMFSVTQPEKMPSHASSFRHRGEDPSGHFEHISEAPSKGVGGCHCGATSDGRAVFISNYKGASVASFSADANGKLTLASHIDFPPDGHGPNPERQQQSYIHSALAAPGDDFVLVNDLGLDRIHIFKLDHATAKLTAHGEWKSAPGSGPRHLAIHPNDRWIYCIHELNSTVALLQWNKRAGTLTTVGAPVSALPEDVSADGKRGCELAFSRDLKFLYASIRVEEMFTVFAIEPKTGALTVVQHLPNPGKESRHIAVSPDGAYFLSANQFSDEISVFPIDRSSGKLRERTNTVTISGPSCLLFA